MKYTHGIIGTHGGALLQERAPGACSGSKILRVYRPLDLMDSSIEMHWDLFLARDSENQITLKQLFSP